MSSYDFLLLKLSNPNASARTLRQEDCAPIGSFDELRRLLESEIQGLRWTTETDTGVIGSGDLPFLMEFQIQRKGDPDIYSIGVIGTTEPEALQLLASLCKRHGWIAYDLQTADFASFTPTPAQR